MSKIDKDSEKVKEQQKDVLDFVKAFNNKLKSRILLLLRIYNELSTTDLCNKLKKTKSTVLRNTESLIESGFIIVREDHFTPGKYPKKYFRLNKKKFTFKYVSGSDLRPLIKDYPQLIIDYIQHVKGNYHTIKNIIDSACIYLDKYEKEVEKNVNSLLVLKKQDNREEIEKEIEDKIKKIELITKDNLGMNSLTYLNKIQMIGFFKDEMDINDVLEDESLREESLPKSYLYLRMLLPIQRVIEINSADEWFIDGNLWPFYDQLE
ncbi:MAG: winged helix-turn-helix domain-containing protein [Candidatus Hodarchaeales archaeon]|jgi:DNA-binding transcriptional ArsR family regulator